MPEQTEAIKQMITYWDGQIKSGLAYRKKFSSEKDWDDLRKMYRGDWATSVLPVNRIFSFGRSMIPQVYFRSPRVCITSQRPEFVWHARVVEAVDNWLIQELVLKYTLKEGALDTYLCGTGPIKLGFDSEFGYNEAQSINEEGKTATRYGRKEGDSLEYRSNITPGMPWALRCDPKDVVTPWGYKQASSLPWIAHRILRPLEDVQNDQKYINTKDLKGTRQADVVRTGPQTTGGSPKEDLFVELWEVRDVKTKHMYVFAEDTMIMADSDPLQIDGMPWEFIIFNPDPEHFWGIPDAKMIKAQQEELNEIRTQEARHRAIALLKLLYLKGSLKGEEITKLLSGEVLPAICVENVDAIQQAIHLLQPHIPPDLRPAAQACLNDMKETLGFSDNQLGSFSPYHNKTATESQVVSQSFEVRNDERRDVVADTLVNIVRKWNQYIFSFWKDEKVIQIAGPTGAQHWIKYTGDQLKGEYLLSVDPENSMPVSRSTRYQSMKDLFGLLNGDTTIDQLKLRQMLTRTYDWIDPQSSQLVKMLPEDQMGAEAAARQPNPMVIGQGQRGGSGPGGQVVPLDKMRGK